MKAPEAVAFITAEQGDDLVVSFAIADEEPGEIVSLILLRTPKDEFILPADERGVSVSHESFPEDEDRDRLRRIRVAMPVVTIETTRTQVRARCLEGRPPRASSRAANLEADELRSALRLGAWPGRARQQL